ncbi:tRNA (adenosine(37)-N6)-threonylcarbamoyltransferase complex dimerization subunit type 1 TsaB [Candidatus Liberibacter sp.]|uniref:tRNA (adenosine(37)-N6)-threonylcarbamoyltransferase complex dimerization subunit type 1 TsaB n=1 Tax=Candidatus Liberibacter sp. TaxID=34022 RepID=UPI0015F6192D|nr:tRNA (adenosine(37)-N6)-threonylcarbamoyltransferase complex dimerization subunit type 1 TsaB [Candidatus Liberibacter sp.]MBA5724100.1 tRNA (adenosine(37)-N6)-threonylcarbamoyltransferase complex dimerization subunit type 1 TsaB [Candidatus Liberibacter sp.]
MIVLALDTTSVDCAVAVYDSDTDCILGSFLKTLGRGHAEYLIQAIDCALKESKLCIAQVERVVTALGPGSFTGIRVSISVARGLSLVLDRPAFGVGNLEVLARARLNIGSDLPIMVVADVLSERVCLQSFSVGAVPLSDPILLTYDQARIYMEKFEGEVIGSGIAAIEGIKGEVDCLPIDVLARLGASTAQASPAPLYLRNPYVSLV